MADYTAEYDVAIIGAGPAGLCAAIRYAQLCQAAEQVPKIVVLEKAAEIGGHILSGCVFNPTALDALLPDWQVQSGLVDSPVTDDQFLWLSSKRSWRLPTPPPLRNSGHFILSLSALCRWLAQQAESLGVDIFPGFPASKVLFNPANEVIGVITGAQGLDKLGIPKPSFQPGMQILAKQSLFAEGCRGSLSQDLIKHFSLAQDKQPQTYGLGVKEIWQVRPEVHRKGTVVHTVGWPLDTHTYGGSFIYHWGENLISVGLVVGLDYPNPFLDPFAELQRLKHHPAIAPLLKDGRCIEYGARALNEGGWQSLPKLTFSGGMLIGCSAGFLNVPQIKGSHNAIGSGRLAAEAVFAALNSPNPGSVREITAYQVNLEHSQIAHELKAVRNIRPAFRYGLWLGLGYAALDTYLFRGHTPWTFSHQADHLATRPASACQKITYPAPDGILSFNKMTALSLSNVHHIEDQPVHLILKDAQTPVKTNWANYAGLEARYCPAGVYEFVEINQQVRLQINASNCIHCKTCDIKDPTQNITWVPPEGGGGPNYTQM